jgi:two-component system sensor histidine kinase DesK
VDARAGELLGQVLRETTTDILRHAQVRITLSRGGIAIVNDGAAEDGRPVPHGGGVPHAEDPPWCSPTTKPCS